VAAENPVGLQLRKADWRLDMAGQKEIDQFDWALRASAPFDELPLAIYRATSRHLPQLLQRTRILHVLEYPDRGYGLRWAMQGFALVEQQNGPGRIYPGLRVTEIHLSGSCSLACEAQYQYRHTGIDQFAAVEPIQEIGFRDMPP